jgi:hypothetical protein
MTFIPLTKYTNTIPFGIVYEKPLFSSSDIPERSYSLERTPS